MRGSISISLPETLRKELDRLVDTVGTTRGDVVRAALEEYLWARRFGDLRRSLIPYAEAQGVVTDEHVFRDVS